MSPESKTTRTGSASAAKPKAEKATDAAPKAAKASTRPKATNGSFTKPTYHGLRQRMSRAAFERCCQCQHLPGCMSGKPIPEPACRDRSYQSDFGSGTD